MCPQSEWSLQRARQVKIRSRARRPSSSAVPFAVLATAPSRSAAEDATALIFASSDQAVVETATAAIAYGCPTVAAPTATRVRHACASWTHRAARVRAAVIASVRRVGIHQTARHAVVTRQHAPIVQGQERASSSS